MASQDFEPDEAVLSALREKMLINTGGQNIETDVYISELKNTLKHHFDLNLKSYQIKEICNSLGFKVATTVNYPKVKANQKLLMGLLTERADKSENIS